MGLGRLWNLLDWDGWVCVLDPQLIGMSLKNRLKKGKK